MLTVILAVVAPVDHKYEDPALDVNVTLPPEQNVNGPPAVIVGIEGIELTVTDVAADATL
jgi:hypothetical protein